MRLRPGPTTVAIASLLCLLAGLLYLATQIRIVFSDQLKEEYAGLVLEAVARAESASDQLRIWQQLPAASPGKASGYEHARAELARRIASLAALANASPSTSPHGPVPVLSAEASFDDMQTALRDSSAYWRAQRDAMSADVRIRTAHVARMLIVLAALLFCMLITALGLYAKRHRQLAGQSHEFQHAALHDPMTGLPNRRKFFATLEEAATKPATRVAMRKIAVLYIDLDGFKQVNDSLGHRAGDEFLVAVSTRFRESVRTVDVVARIGGDEFVVLVRTFSTEAELAEIARRLIACVIHTDEQMGIGLVRASIGIASFPDPVDDYRRLVAAADDAMYQVKRSGKNGYAFVAGPGRPARS